MNTKNDVEVIINGKQYTLSGYESSEYLQKIANHINDKIAEFKEQDGYLRLGHSSRHIISVSRSNSSITPLPSKA